METRLPGLLALGTSPPPKATHRTSFAFQPPVLRGGTVAFERTHLPPTSQVDLSAPASPKREPTAAAAADAAAVVDDAACIADVTARLAFSAYFCEGVPQSALEVERVRRVAMFWYPSDGSVSLAEVGARNDGFASFGHYTFKRARVPGLALGDLAVGATVTVGGRAFTVCGADAAARAALEAAGLPRQQPDFEPPFDAFSVRAAADAAAAGAWQGKKSSASTRFVEAAARGQLKPLRREFDGAPPLRFLLHWAPPPEALAGTTTMGKPPPARAQLFHYWLAFDLPSGELEIRAAKGPDGGVRDGGVATLVRRGKLPKALTSLGPTEIGALTAVDAGDLPPPVQWVGEDDLRCGTTLSVCGRDLTVADCDDATQAWYAQHKGIDQRAGRVVVEPPPPPKREARPEPLVPRAVRPDRKLGAGRGEPTGATSRFTARLVATNDVDAERVFKLTYFHDDASLAATEVPLRNSGIPGGVFQKRAPTALAVEQLRVVGAEVVVKGHRMVIAAVEGGGAGGAAAAAAVPAAAPAPATELTA